MEERGTSSGVTPHITIRDNRAAEAIDWYKRAFGAEEVMRHPTDDGRLDARASEDQRRPADAPR